MRLSNAIVLVNCLRALLNTCSYQIVICQISFEIHMTRGYCIIHAKRIYQNAKNQQIVFCSKHKKFIVDDKETTDQTHILECIKQFYETPFKKIQVKTRDKN